MYPNALWRLQGVTILLKKTHIRHLENLCDRDYINQNGEIKAQIKPNIKYPKIKWVS